MAATKTTSLGVRTQPADPRGGGDVAGAEFAGGARAGRSMAAGLGGGSAAVGGGGRNSVAGGGGVITIRALGGTPMIKRGFGGGAAVAPGDAAATKPSNAAMDTRTVVTANANLVVDVDPITRNK